MHTSASDTTDGRKRLSPEHRGEVIGYAFQQGTFSLAANIFEPYVNKRFQDYISRHTLSHPKAGNFSQNLVGEFAGDLIGTSTLVLAEVLCPRPLHTAMGAARNMLDPVYKSIAHAVFADKRLEPDYDQQVERWKTIQERNFVRSSIMAAAGIAGNVAVQKWIMKNPAPSSVVFMGKALSTLLTTSIGLTTRFTFPEQMKKLDNLLGDKVFAPMLDDMHEKETQISHVERVQSESSKGNTKALVQ